jgi:hypothetical protein
VIPFALCAHPAGLNFSEKIRTLPREGVELALGALGDAGFRCARCLGLRSIGNLPMLIISLRQHLPRRPLRCFFDALPRGR